MYVNAYDGHEHPCKHILCHCWINGSGLVADAYVSEMDYRVKECRLSQHIIWATGNLTFDDDVIEHSIW